MLGHVVARELEQDARFHVKKFCRVPRVGERFVDARSNEPVEGLHRFDYVINCIGLIKQLHDVDRRDWFTINSIFPWVLATQCQEWGGRLIQISTDCVYDGTAGQYAEDDKHDATDDYGLSKSLGEPPTAMVLRTSVIGPELRGKLSLLEWAISKRGQCIDGYENHIWNGLTSLEYAIVCKKIMARSMFEPGVFHVHSDAVTKHKLLSMINDAYDLDLDIRPTNSLTFCDRTLRSIKTLNRDLAVPSTQEMINALAAKR